MAKTSTKPRDQKHHAWCGSSGKVDACRQCVDLFGSYPFRPGETSAAATMRYFPAQQPAAPVSRDVAPMRQVSPGRPRAVPITLPILTYRHIDDSTLSKPTGTDETTRQLAEIFEDAFVALGEAQDHRVSLRQQADPLGIRTGAYSKRIRTTVGEVTDERLTKAQAASVKLVTEKETFEDGRPTGLQRNRLVPLLEVWRNKGVIDFATFSAAEAFQRDCDLAIEASPRMISRYGHIMPGGVPELLPQEIQIEFQKRKRAAMRGIEPRLHMVLGWIAEVSNSEVLPDTVAAKYWPRLGEKTRMERFKGLLDYVCMLLSVHYGHTDDKSHRWVRLAISKAAQEVYELLNA